MQAPQTVVAGPLAPRGGRSAVRLLTALILVGCSATATTEAPRGEPLVRGPVESIEHRATASGILVGAGQGSREMCGIAATVDAETRYYRENADRSRTPASMGEIQTGDTVEVFVDGPVAESCPVQGRASAIVLVGG